MCSLFKDCPTFIVVLLCYRDFSLKNCYKDYVNAVDCKYLEFDFCLFRVLCFTNSRNESCTLSYSTVVLHYCTIYRDHKG